MRKSQQRLDNLHTRCLGLKHEVDELTQSGVDFPDIALRQTSNALARLGTSKPQIQTT
jgi:hypothetical protein